MSNPSGGGSNTALYVVGGVALVGVISICCVAAGAAGMVVMTRRRAVEAMEAEDRAYEQAREERLAAEAEEAEAEERRRAEEAARGAFVSDGDVSLTPPASLAVIPTPTSDRRTRHVEATVTHSEGSVGISVGDHCSFDVRVLDRSSGPGFWCRAFAECNGVRVFGQEVPHRTGFFTCELYDVPFGVAGEDLETTIDAANGDPMFQIDSRSMRFMAADSAVGPRGAAFRVEARIDSVTAR